MSEKKVFVASPEAKGKAKQLRIFAMLAWIAAIAGQVYAILNLISDEKMMWLIGAIVVILILAITGSTLWKNANKLDPASEAEPTRFFIQNQLGAIMGVLAFLPMVIMILNNKEISKTSNDEQIKLVYQSLGKKRTLLIVDNLETIKGTDRDDILGFLSNLPNTVQSVITTRERVWLYSPISLQSLSPEHSIEVIQKQAKKKNIHLSTNDSHQLYERFGGIPLALIYLVGQLAGTYSLNTLLDSSLSLPEDIASFCFEESVKPLRHKPAHSLLMSLAIFRTKSEWKALARVAGLEREPLEMEKGLDRLKQLSLVYPEEDKYKILPITREYALVELSKFPTLEQNLRERWIDYYLEFTEQYGGKDWKRWRIKYDVLEEDWSNVLQVLDWCAANGLYDRVIKIWKNVDNYIDLKGDWNNRLKWWKWLEIQSSQRQDWSIYIDAFSAQAWILILKGGSYLNEVSEKIESAYKIVENPPEVCEAKANLGIVNSIWLKTNCQHQESLDKLDEVEQLIKKIHLEEKYRLRYLTRINYYRAEVYNCQYNSNRDLTNVKNLLNQVCQQGEAIGSSRFVNYAQNELANIAISEQDYDKAKKMIDRGLREAELWRELTRIGHWLASFWRLAKSQGNLEQAEEYYAKSALGYFSTGEGMIKDAEEMKDWLNNRNVQ